MKILHITSDWKWTGPAEPMLVLLQALRARGHEADLACAEPPDPSERSLSGEARTRGVTPQLSLLSARGIRWRRDAPDARRLRELILAEGVELIHAWHTRDHVLAIRAARGTRTAVVRTLPAADPVSGAPWNRWLFGPGTHGLLCVSREVERRCAKLRGGRPIAACLGAVELDRFRPRGVGDSQSALLRAKLGLAADAAVIGIVARVQPHRRFDLLLGAMGELVRTHAHARLVIIGRGTQLDAVAKRPVATLGLADHVVFAGYRRDDYADVLRALDIFTLLVPGSDGTCRAVLEAAACGLPTVATRRGALSEIVVDGETGLLVDETPASLAAAWRRLLDDPAERARLGRAAHQRACREFRPQRLAKDVELLYAAALSAR